MTWQLAVLLGTFVLTCIFVLIAWLVVRICCVDALAESRRLTDALQEQVERNLEHERKKEGE